MINPFMVPSRHPWESVLPAPLDVCPVGDPGSSVDMPGDRTQEGAHGNWKRAIFGFSGLTRKHELTIAVESLPRVTVTNSGGCQTPAPGRKVSGILTPIRRMFEPLGTGAGSQFYPPPDGCS